MSASRALTRLEGLGLLHRSEQRRGPGVYYTLPPREDRTDQVTHQMTHHVTDHGERELPIMLAEGKRLSQQEMADLIVTLCTPRPHTARELAGRLHRNIKYLRDAYLAPLVREGRLKRTGAPNDPNVAYRAVSPPSDERGESSR